MPLWPDFRGEMVLISTTVQRQILTTQHEAGPGGQDGYAILKEKLGSKWTRACLQLSKIIAEAS